MASLPITLTTDAGSSVQSLPTNGAAPHQPAPAAPVTEWGYVDEEGRLVISPEMQRALGWQPGARLRLERDGNTVRLHRPLNQLAKVYIEPTNACNLDCVTCFRNCWDTSIGRMTEATFASILAGLAAIDPLPTVYFGGIGEPMFHQRTVDWIAQVKQLGARVELITNGTLLTEQRSRQLIDAGLDLLVGLHRRRVAGELRRCPPGRRIAQSPGQPPAFPHPAQRAQTRQARDRHRLCGDEAQHWRSAQGAEDRPATGRIALLGEQRPADHRGAAGRGALHRRHAFTDLPPFQPDAPTEPAQDGFQRNDTRRPRLPPFRVVSASAMPAPSGAAATMSAITSSPAR